MKHANSWSSCRRLFLGLFLLAGGCSYEAGDGSGAGPGRREQPLALSPNEELALGRRAYREVLRGWWRRISQFRHDE
jgi:hypothetical protein